MIYSVGLLLLTTSVVSAGTIIASSKDRDSYIQNAKVWFEDYEKSISTRDMLNGPPNPYDLETFQVLDCDFVEPDPEDLLGGTTPKFKCEFEYKGEKVQVKVKYDQQYNSVYQWGRGNQEVYTSIVAQRILWATGFGADQSVPVFVNCRNCPIEPWTYIQAVQGYVNEDIMSGWIDVPLLKSGGWNQTADVVSFAAAIVYIKLDKYMDGDEIDYLDVNGTQQRGFFWPELYTKPTEDETQSVARDALSVIAAFLSYCDNFDGNQGFICLDEDDSKRTDSKAGKDKTECKGDPLMYIHDVGGTLGYGWNLKHKNFWPNYFDLQQWQEVSTWGDLAQCQVYVNGIPGCSWRGNQAVSEEGRAMAARLLSQITDNQLTDLFTAAKAPMMRGESVADWVAGFKAKLQKEVLDVACTAAKK